jgi:hypothetical protein
MIITGLAEEPSNLVQCNLKRYYIRFSKSGSYLVFELIQSCLKGVRLLLLSFSSFSGMHSVPLATTEVEGDARHDFEVSRLPFRSRTRLAAGISDSCVSC